MSAQIILPKHQPREALADRLRAFVLSLPLDKAWRFECVEHRPTRSNSQNAYLWGVCYPTILKGGGELLGGWTADDLHEYYLGEHFGWETLEAFGKRRMKPLRRSSRLSKTEFMDFVAFIQRSAAELGIFIADPDQEHMLREVS